MRFIDGRLVHTPSDLTGFLECGHLSGLERAAAEGRLRRSGRDAATDLLAGKGLAHETRYRDELIAQGRTFADLTLLEGTPRELAAGASIAMDRGVDVIYQATLFDGAWLGRADFLLRVETPSATRAWSYEVADTKLALAARASAIVQLARYSDALGVMQGVAPREMHLVLGSGERKSYTVRSYQAYVHTLAAEYLRAVESDESPYPLPVPYCAQCSWSDGCDARRAHDDHLSLVANLRRDQVKRFEAAGITSMSALARSEDDARPRDIATSTFERLRRQARLQSDARDAAQQTGRPVYVHEVLAPKKHAGFALLPPASQGDLFFDMEGDPLYEARRGLEYLFGNTFADGSYRAIWAHDRDEERIAFEQCVDLFIEHRRADPAMHVYHYAPYEKSALRRLSAWFETREAEVIRLLEDGVLVDLYAVVRGGVMVSQPSYSIKKLEPFYGFTRDTDVKAGDDSVVAFETWLVNREQTELLDDIERYNAADCESTRQLRLWLDDLHAQAERQFGVTIAFDPPVVVEDEDVAEPADSEAAEKKREKQRERQERREHLRTTETATKERDRLLASLLGYYRRERKPALREFFERCENAEHLLEDDAKAIGGVTLDPSVAPIAPAGRVKSWTYGFRFAPQRCEPETGSWVDAHTQQPAGTMQAWDIDAAGGGTFTMRVNAAIEDPSVLRALVRKDILPNDAHEDRLAEIAGMLADATLPQRHVARDLLTAAAPVFRTPRPGGIVQPATPNGAAIAELAELLDASCLVVQGPPGTGKTTAGADAIVTLLARGLRIGITARSHAAIDNLLARVDRVAHARGVAFSGARKFGSANGDADADVDDKAVVTQSPSGRLVEFKKKHWEKLAEFTLLAGTSWFFAAEAMRESVDVLFVDEAGQLPLADAVAMSLATRNMVLLGDPLQLRQVVQGDHQDGADASVLKHLLGDQRTVPPERGVFLDRSYRMHPDICAFVSEMIYDDRLRASDAAAANAVASEVLTGSGLRFIACEHHGNSRDSREEADAVARHAVALLRGRVTIGDAPQRALTERDILVVTPYNAQRRLIERVLRDAGLGAVRVGTVDKFQGQEAPVVFYSMATSSQDDLPRDIAFLFEANRFNVAVSRAQALCVVVASPALLHTRCKTPEEIAMVNLLCRYVERATVVRASAEPRMAVMTSSMTGGASQ